MKYSILILIGSLFVLTKALTRNEIKQTLETFAAECEPKPDEQDINDLIDSKADPRQSTKCIRKCIMTNFGVIKDDQIDVDQLKQFYGMAFPGDEEIGAEMATICNKEVTEKEPCERVHQFAMCGIKEMKARNIEMQVPE